MAFFDAGTDEHGKATLEVSPLWWYFPAITAPLTIAVPVIWEVWRRKRQSRREPKWDSQAIKVANKDEHAASAAT